MEFAADLVWALAVAADRINGGYLKEPEWDMDQTPPVVKRDANKLMVKHWLRTGDFRAATEADYQAGREVRSHINGWTFKVMMGKANDFERQALKIAQMEEFTGRNLLEFAVICCLPAAARRDAAATELKRDIYQSEQLVGQVGDEVRGDVEVISCRYNQQYGKWRITGRMGESFVDFWFGKEVQPKVTLHIKGKIKAVREDKTTQLNYVKKC